MTDYADLRRALANQLGDERYRRFVEAGVRKGRLRYWQESVWSHFTAEHPECSISIDELGIALRVCPLHGDELQPDSVKVFKGCIDFTREFVQSANNLFPHAADFFSSEGNESFGDRVDLWYCPSCRKAKVAWRATQKK
jgi:hypothetical protein